MPIFAAGLVILLSTFALMSKRVLARMGAAMMTIIGVALLVIGAQSAQGYLTWGNAAAFAFPLSLLGVVYWICAGPASGTALKPLN